MLHLLEEKIELYLIDEKLKQSQHTYCTQLNEATHFCINCSAPKHLNYSRTNSLQSRVSVALGTQSEGMEKFMLDITREKYCLPCTTAIKNWRVELQKQYKR